MFLKVSSHKKQTNLWLYVSLNISARELVQLEWEVNNQWCLFSSDIDEAEYHFSVQQKNMQARFPGDQQEKDTN